MEQIISDPSLAEVRDKLANYYGSAATGRIVNRDLKVADLAEAKELIDLGRKSKAGSPPPSGGDPKPPAPVQSDDAKAILADKLALEAKLNQDRQAYAGKVMTAELKSLYLSQNGLEKLGDAEVWQQAIQLMLASGEFDVDADFNVVTKSGISAADKVALWMKKNPHYLKPAGTVTAPPAPGKDPITGPKPSGLVDRYTQYLKSR